MCELLGGWSFKGSSSNLCQVDSMQFHWQEWKNFWFMFCEKKIWFCNFILPWKGETTSKAHAQSSFHKYNEDESPSGSCWQKRPYSLLTIFSEELIRTSSSTLLSAHKRDHLSVFLLLLYLLLSFWGEQGGMTTNGD